MKNNTFLDLIRNYLSLRRMCAPCTLSLFLIFYILQTPGCTSGTSRSDPAAITDRAVQELNYFNFKKAHRLFTHALKRTEKGSESWQKALFGKSVAVHHIFPCTQENIQEAEEGYQLLIQTVPDSGYAPRCMLHIGRIRELPDFYQDEKKPAEARKWYTRVIKTWPESNIASEAALRTAATYIQTFDADEVRKGISYLKEWLRKHPGNALASGMWMYIGDTCLNPLNEYQNSLDSYIKADTIGFPEPERAGRLYWRMAVIAETHLDDKTNAEKYYRKIIEITPTSGKAYEAQLALKRMGIDPPPIRTLGTRQPMTEKSR